MMLKLQKFKSFGVFAICLILSLAFSSAENDVQQIDDLKMLHQDFAANMPTDEWKLIQQELHGSVFLDHLLGKSGSPKKMMPAAFGLRSETAGATGLIERANLGNNERDDESHPQQDRPKKNIKSSNYHRLVVKRKERKIFRPKHKKVNYKCKWLSKCFVHDVKFNPREMEGTCLIDNILKDSKHIPSAPYPHDSYVSGRVNSMDDGEGDLRLGPRIELWLISKNRKRVKMYTWKEFTKEYTHILNRDIVFNSLGPHHVILKAYNYDLKNPAVCEMDLVIRDNTRPLSTAKCPTTRRHFTDLGYYNVRYYQRVAWKIRKYLSWHFNRKDDPCGKSKNCDLSAYLTRSFGCKSYSPIRNLNHFRPESFFYIDRKDHYFMKKRLHRKLLSNSPGDPKLCTKCLFLAHQFREVVNNWTCKKRKTGPQCLGGQFCRTFQCLRGTGRLFFGASSSIKLKYKTPYKGYNRRLKQNIIYLRQSRYCKKINKLCTFVVLRDVISTGISSKNKELFSLAMAHQAVKFRYRILYYKWRNFDHNSRTMLTHGNMITLEAWSTCGMVYRKKYFVKVQKCKSSSKY